MEISLIIPVYNTEKYLDECLKSIEKQTIDKSLLEVIIINDGSTDSSLNIINNYINKNKWILINQKNSGLSISRNNGINISKGKYIMFLDSDDYIEKDTLKDMYEAIKKNNSDLVIGKINAFDSKGFYGYYFDKVINKNETYYFNENKKIIKTISVCSKLYKKDIIKDVKFIPNLKHEDNYFTVKLYLKNIKITTLNKYYYFRRYREGERDSITQNLNINTLNDLIKNYIYLWNNNKIDSDVLMFNLKSLVNYNIKNVDNKKEGLNLILNYLKSLKRKLSKIKYTYYKTYILFYYKLANIYYIERSKKWNQNHIIIFFF